jgi:hypothetical protein
MAKSEWRRAPVERRSPAPVKCDKCGRTVGGAHKHNGWVKWSGAGYLCGSGGCVPWKV